ncbi:histone lysine methyltransferase Set9 [Tilletia horrida]|nr:histone lysine methyltransferase Set9 [Tilletia horrida]
MPDLSHDDDVLSDILVDNLGYDCALSTHKMNPSYRPQRVHASLVNDLVWRKVVCEHNITGAVEELCMMGMVKKYIADKDQRQLHAFKLHAKRYFEAYHPDAGVEFVQSTRYARASALLKQAAAEKAGVGKALAGTAGPSAAASTSAVTLPAIPTATTPSPVAAAPAAAAAATADASTVVPAPVKTESVSSVDASNALLTGSKVATTATGASNAQHPEAPAESMDVVMTDAQPADVPSLSDAAAPPAPVPNGSVMAASNSGAQAPDANGGAAHHNGTAAGAPSPADPPGTGASTPTSSSAVSKGKRRVPSEASKGVKAISQQLATPWSDAFATHEKADMAVVAIKSYREGDFIEGLKGGVKDLTREEDEAMKIEAAAARERLGPGQIAATAAPARDFSVIRSAQKGCSQLLLGPARFVNHDCNPNVEFYRSGQSILFRCTRPIQPKDEITCYYGPNYFEWDNAECLCATCEARGKGAFSALMGTKYSIGGPHYGSPELAHGADGEIPGFSPGPESSANSVNGSEGGSSNGTATGAAGGSRRSSARVAMVQASGKTRRMTPGGVPFPSMSTNPTLVSSNGAALSRRTSPLSDTNVSGISAAEVDGGIGLGVGLPPGGPDVGSGLAPPFAPGSGVKSKAATLTCGTCQDRFEWSPTWYVPQQCGRCVRHEKIYRAAWPMRTSEVALEGRQMLLEKKQFKRERMAGASGSERAAKKAKLAKKRAEPTRIALEIDAASAAAAPKQTNGKGKEKAVGGVTGMSPAGSSSIASGSADSAGLSSDSDSDLTELASDDEEDDSVRPDATRDFEMDAGDADETLGGRDGARAGAKGSGAGPGEGDGRRNAGKGASGSGGGGGGASLLNLTTNTAAGSSVDSGQLMAFPNYASRYGPTGKAVRAALDFQARRREKPEPAWTKADDEDRRRSSRMRNRRRTSGSGLSKGGEGSSTRRKSRRERGKDGEDGSSSSSSRSSSPAGPPVLGKDANLQNLAGFWGATDGERRVRKPVFSGGVKSLLERQRAEAAARRRAREREEAKAERRRKADRRRRESEGGKLVKSEKGQQQEDVKPQSSVSTRRSRSPDKAGRRSLDSALASSKASKKSSLSSGSSRKSVDVLQPLRSSNRQALKRDRMLAVGAEDDDDDDEDGEDDDSDEDDDFDLSDVSSSSDDDDEEMEEAAAAAEAERREDDDKHDGEEQGKSRSSKSGSSRSKTKGDYSKRGDSSSDEDDDGSSDDSDMDASGSSHRRSKKKRFVFSRSSSPQPAIPGLATKGPERTSNANLALAWSAGIEEGTKRTRKPVQREPIAVAKGTSGARSPSMGASSGRGRSSETPKPSSSSRDHRPTERSRMRSTSDAGDQEQDRKRRARTSPAMSAASASSAAHAGGSKGASSGGRQSYPAGSGAVGRSSSSTVGLGARAAEGRGAPTTAGPGKFPLGAYPSQRVLSGPSSAAGAAPLAGGPGGAALSSRRYSSSSSSQPDSPATVLKSLPSPANPPVPGFRRPASPAGAPLSLAPVGAGGSVVRNAGAPRKNLRWGSGKVSHSRPSPHLVGGALPSMTASATATGGGSQPGSTSPVAGPATSTPTPMSTAATVPTPPPPPPPPPAAAAAAGAPMGTKDVPPPPPTLPYRLPPNAKQEDVS